MIKATHIPFFVRFFNRYIPRQINRHFHQVVVYGDVDVQNDKSIVLLGNHISWWDGFFAVYLNINYFHKQFHVMMLEEQLLQHKIFAKAGAFSIRKNSKSIIDSIQYSRDLLHDPQNLIVLFPQGIIHSMYENSISFEKGITKILRGKDDVSVYLFAAFIDYLENKKPTLYLYVEKNKTAASLNHSLLENAYIHFYTACYENQKSKIK